MIFHRAVFSLWALSLLGACAVLAPQEPVARSAPFDVLGRVLVGYEGKAFSSSVRWWHGTEHDEVWMMAPTGQTLAHVREDSTGATITAADQTKYHGTRVEALTRQALGWEFPLAHLQHWLRAAPAPNRPADITERDSSGRITRMTQDGWRIAYEYAAVPEYDGLPRRVDVSSAAQNIRLVIDSWRRESEAGDSSQGAPMSK